MPDKQQYNSNRERKKNSKYQNNDNIYSSKHIRNKEFILDKIKNDKKEIEKKL
tara:strand:- start:39 stop:197 length:159 start_codon:yes stop_codon:yes gene_type:complete